MYCMQSNEARVKGEEQVKKIAGLLRGGSFRISITKKNGAVFMDLSGESTEMWRDDVVKALAADPSADEDWRELVNEIFEGWLLKFAECLESDLVLTLIQQEEPNLCDTLATTYIVKPGATNINLWDLPLRFD